MSKKCLCELSSEERNQLVSWWARYVSKQERIPISNALRRHVEDTLYSIQWIFIAAYEEFAKLHPWLVE